MRRLLPLALVVALAAGCTAITPVVQSPQPTPAPSTQRVSEEPDYVPLDPEGSEHQQTSTPTVGPDGSPATEPVTRASAETIRPDPAIMETMECESLSTATAERIHQLWGEPVEKGVQVEVGEGLTAGETWWVVTYLSTSEREGRRRSERLTNHPGVPDERGEWFILGRTFHSTNGTGFTWDNVQWDAERLARGQSALAMAHECLGELSD